MWAVGTGVAHSSIPQKKYEVSHGIFLDRLWQFASLNCHLTYWKPVAVHIFSSEHTVYSPVKAVY